MASRTHLGEYVVLTLFGEVDKKQTGKAFISQPANFTKENKLSHKPHNHLIQTKVGV